MKGRRILSVLLSVCLGCGAAAGLPVRPEKAGAGTVYAAEKEPVQEPEERTGTDDTAAVTTAPPAEETAVPATVTTLTTAAAETETATVTTAAEAVTSSAKSSVSTKKSSSSAQQTTATVTTVTEAVTSSSKSSSSTKKSSSSAQQTTTTVTTAAEAVTASSKSSSSTKKSTTKQSASSVTTTTTAVMSASEAAETTEEVLHPTLAPILKSSYPGGSTMLTLWMTDNPGVEAIGLSVRLPDVLRPRKVGEDSAEVIEGALSGRLLCCYNEEKNLLSLDYITDGGAKKEPLLCSIPLDISPDAVIGRKYGAVLKLDSILLAQDAVLETGVLTLNFTPTAPLQRELPAELTMTKQGGTKKLALTPAPPAGSCEWESSAPEIVSVDENGVLTAHRCGEAEITVRCETLVYHCKVTSALKREILPAELTLTAEQEEIQLSLSPVPLSGITWSSSDPSVAEVGADGVLRAVESGTAEITAECEGMTYRCTVTVRIPMSLNYAAYSARSIGETVQLMLLHAPAGSAVTWESSAPETAAVDETGLVTLTGFGEAEIAAVCGGERVICRVTNPEVLRGDVDGDRSVTAYDASLALIGFLERTNGFAEDDRTLTPAQEQIGDVDGDGELTAFDASMILSYFTLSTAGGYSDLTWEDILPAGSGQ